jgi:hypothetical protein
LPLFAVFCYLPGDCFQSYQLYRVLPEGSAHIAGHVLGIHENIARDLQTEYWIEGAHQKTHDPHNSSTLWLARAKEGGSRKSPGTTSAPSCLSGSVFSGVRVMARTA